MLDDGRPVFFASGPSKKFPAWDTSIFASELLNRTHIFETRGHVKMILDRMKTILSIPDEYRLILVPGSGSGAIFCGFLNFLDPSRRVECYVSGFFSRQWSSDLAEQFKLPTTVIDFNDAVKASLDADRMLVMVETPTGIGYANYDFLPTSETVGNDGLTFVDAVCAAFLEDIPWDKFDVISFSAQKILGGDGSIGLLALSPKAIKRLPIPKPWPIGRLFNINLWSLNEVLNGRAMSTPSVLSLIELQHILDWVEKNGSLRGLQALNSQNWKIVSQFLAQHPEIDYFVQRSEQRGRALVCLEHKAWKLDLSEQKMFKMKEVARLAAQAKVYDIENFVIPAWRFWIGPMQLAQDVAIGLNRFYDCIKMIG